MKITYKAFLSPQRSSPWTTTTVRSYVSPQFSYSNKRRHQSSSRAQSFLDVVKARRSNYELGRDVPVSNEIIIDIINTTTKHCPSSFNAQSARLVALFNDHHEKLWQITTDTLKAIVPPENFGSTQKKLDGFRGAYGTVLFYEDPNPTKSLQDRMPLYASKFPMWAEQSNAMHQYIVWTALHANGLGCNLQHYNPLIDQKVAAEWNIDPEWSLKAQLVFGGIKAPPGEKTYEPLDKRVIIHGLQ